MLSILFNALLLVKNWRRLEVYMRILACWLIALFVVQFAMAVLAELGIPNQYLTHYYVVGQFVLLTFFYFSVLEKFKKYIAIGGGIFFAFFAFQLLASPFDFNSFNTPSYLISSCVIMLYTMLYFMENIQKKRVLDLFNMGVFMYFGASSILFFTINHWKEFADWNVFIWTLNASLFLLFQLMVTGSIYLDIKHKNN